MALRFSIRDFQRRSAAFFLERLRSRLLPTGMLLILLLQQLLLLLLLLWVLLSSLILVEMTELSTIIVDSDDNTIDEIIGFIVSGSAVLVNDPVVFNSAVLVSRSFVRRRSFILNVVVVGWKRWVRLRLRRPGKAE